MVAASHVAFGEGEVIIDDGAVIDSGCHSCGGDGCNSCSVGAGVCNTCAVPSKFCICFPSHGWVHAEYLNWYQSGMRIPTLVTTSPTGTARTAAGVLPAAQTLYGGQDYHDDNRSGFRIRFGWWLRAIPGWGIEGEYVGLGEDTETFSMSSAAGSPILARPFFNVVTGAEDAELVSFPGVVNGNINVTSSTQFDGAAVRLRKQLFGTNGCGYSSLACQTVPTSSRWDMTIGYRFWELDESLSVNENLVGLGTNANTAFNINDRFETRNQFNGAELGIAWQGRRGWWSMDALMRMAIGNVHQTVTITGDTRITENGAVTQHQQGILAGPGNIGTRDRNEFTIVPELGLTLGYQMTKRVRLTAGYSLIYIGNTVRPGDQVSLDLNPNMFPPANQPVTGVNRPQFQFQDTDYWVQGLSYGGEFRW